MTIGQSVRAWLRETSYRVVPSRRRIRVLGDEIQARSLAGQDVHDFISAAIEKGTAFSYVRPGGTEADGLYTFVSHRFRRGKRRSNKPYSRFFESAATSFSGIQYRNRQDLDYFCMRYLEATISADLMGFGAFAPGALGIARLRAEIGLPVAPFEAIEPIRAWSEGMFPWTKSLAGKRVLVVHPFSRTIAHQFQRKDKVTGVKEVLPDLSLSIMRPPITLDPRNKSLLSWASQFKDLVDASLEMDFDVAIVGAGGYGAPLTHAIRLTGRVAIHTAGATQLIFGIRGKRWESDPVMARYFDSSWVRPFEEDLSPEIKVIDGFGAYH